MTKAIVAAASCLAACSVSLAGEAQGWPRWRGPAADGISNESGWNPEALPAASNGVWQAQVGEGFSSLAIANGRLYTMGNEGDRDSVWCLDAATGKVLWRYPYACRKETQHGGPRSTPTVDRGLVFTLSRAGDVLCLDAATGALKWSTNVVAALKVENIGWGFSGSPLVVGDKLVLNAGKTGVCLNRLTGATIWGAGGAKGGYATPVLYEVAGRQWLAIFGEKALFGVALTDGAAAWSVPWETAYDVNAADPVFAGGKLFVSSGYDHGCALLDVTGAEPRMVWENKSMRNQFQSSVLWKGCIYGIDGNTGAGKLRCLDFGTGAEKWSADSGFGSLILVDGKLIVLNENGWLGIVEATPDGYRKLAEARVLTRKVCWTPPAFCGGKVYCRNKPGDLVCVDLSK